MDSDLSFFSAKSAIIVSHIFEVLNQLKLRTAIFCSNIDELRFILFCLDKSSILKNNYIQYTPFLTLNIPLYKQKDRVSCEWNKSSVLVTDFRSFRGCEVEHSITFVDPQNIQQGSILVESLTRAVLKTSFFVVPPKRKPKKNEKSLNAILEKWKQTKFFQIEEIIVKKNLSFNIMKRKNRKN